MLLKLIPELLPGSFPQSHILENPESPPHNRCPGLYLRVLCNQPFAFKEALWHVFSGSRVIPLFSCRSCKLELSRGDKFCSQPQ